MSPPDVAFAAVLLGLLGPRAAISWRFRGRAREGFVHGEPEPVRLPLIMLLGALGFLGAVLALAAPATVRTAALPLPDAVRWLGLPLGLAGIALFLATHRALGTNFSPRVAVRADHRLVASGPYRWVRHPMYTSLLLWAPGLVLLSANLAAGLPWVLLAVLAASRAPAEEALLARVHGAEYRAYLARTGRFLPRWSPGPAPQG